VVIGFVSAYGHTRAMAELIASGVQSQGGFEVIQLDFGGASDAEIKRVMSDFDGLIIGSPTINADVVEPVWRALSYVSAINAKGKLASAFGNYGWSGEAVGLLENRLERMRMAIVQPGLKVRFGLSDQDRQRCVEFGKTFAQAMIKED
jgi:flavorubredoxin